MGIPTSDQVLLIDRLFKHALKHIATSGVDQPAYHSLDHLIGHMHRCITLYSELEGEPKTSELAALVVASLFHDFGHTGGREPDQVNIEIAQGAVVQYIAKLYEEDFVDLELGDEEMFTDLAVRLVGTTLYPPTCPPADQLEACMRDADLLYGVMSEDPTLIMEDLRSELEIAQGGTVSYEEMLRLQKDFLERAVMYTEPGKKYWDRYAQAYYRIMEHYVGILKPIREVTPSVREAARTLVMSIV